MHVIDDAAALILLAPFVCLVKVAPKCLIEGNFPQGLGSFLEALVQRLELCKHALNVVLAEVESRRLLKPLVPHLMPQNGDADEFLAHKKCLFHKHGRVQPHCVHDGEGGTAAGHRLRLGRHGQRVDKGLGMLPTNVRKQLVDETADHRTGRVNARDELWYHLQPRVNRHGLDPLHHGIIHLHKVPVLEPQRQQSQCVLQRIAPEERNRAEKALQRRCKVRAHAVFPTPALLIVANRLKVHERPRVPRLVPAVVQLRRLRIRVQNQRDGIVRQRVLKRRMPLAQLQVTPREQAGLCTTIKVRGGWRRGNRCAHKVLQQRVCGAHLSVERHVLHVGKGNTGMRHVQTGKATVALGRVQAK
eukprot:Opistho-2@34173